MSPPCGVDHGSECQATRPSSATPCTFEGRCARTAGDRVGYRRHVHGLPTMTPERLAPCSVHLYGGGVFAWSRAPGQFAAASGSSWAASIPIDCLRAAAATVHAQGCDQNLPRSTVTPRVNSHASQTRVL